MVIKQFVLLGLATEHRSRWWVWSTEVYYTHWWTKLTAPETISSSRDMVGAHQNLNGSCDLTMPLSGMFAIRGLALATINLTAKSEAPTPHSMKIWKVKRNIEKSKMGWFWVVKSHSRSTEIATIDKNIRVLISILFYVPVLHRFWDIARH